MKKTKLALVLALGLVSLGLTSPALAKSNKQPFNSNYGSDVYKLGYEDKLLEDNKSSDSSKKSSESKSYGPDVPDDIKKKNESEKKKRQVVVIVLLQKLMISQVIRNSLLLGLTLRGIRLHLVN